MAAHAPYMHKSARAAAKCPLCQANAREQVNIGHCIDHLLEERAKRRSTVHASQVARRSQVVVVRARVSRWEEGSGKLPSSSALPPLVERWSRRLHITSLWLVAGGGALLAAGLLFFWRNG